MNKLKDIDYYFVTHSALSKNDIYSDVKNAIKAGCKIIQYREKNKDTLKMIDEAKKLKSVCEDKAIFLVNDRVDIAIIVDADGVHIGQDDISVEKARRLLGKDKIIGLTVHNVDEAVKAEKQGADYIGLAPIFDTDTKKDSLKPCGLDMVKCVKNKLNIPVIAVGGIKKTNVKDVIAAGADSAVAVSDVLKSDDIYKEIFDFINLIKEVKFP